MITITLEGNTWEEISREMCIAQEAIKRSRIEAKPDKGIVAPDERECQDAPKKPVCAYCSDELSWHEYKRAGKTFCSRECADRYEHSWEKADCRKCHRESLAELASILKGGYGLGPDEVYDILERVR